jgi:hypothetical protein
VEGAARSILRLTDEERQTPAWRVARERIRHSTRHGGFHLPGLLGESRLSHYSSWASTLAHVHARLNAVSGDGFAASTALALALVPEDVPWGRELRASYAGIEHLGQMGESSRARLDALAPEGRASLGVGVQRVAEEGGVSMGYRDLVNVPIPKPEELHRQPLPKLQTRIGRVHRGQRVLDFIDRQVRAGGHMSVIRTFSSSAGGVSFTVSDSPSVHAAPADSFRMALRTTMGLPPPPGYAAPERCPGCLLLVRDVHGRYGYTPERALLDHIPRCPVGCMAHTKWRAHNAVARELRHIIIHECGIASSKVVQEPLHLRQMNSAERPGDLVVKGYNRRLGKDLIIDVSVRDVYSQSAYHGPARVPGGVAARGEADKLRSQAAVELGARHIFVPFIMENGGRLGGHAVELLRDLQRRSKKRGMVAKWTQRLSATVAFGAVDELMPQCNGRRVVEGSEAALVA